MKSTIKKLRREYADQPLLERHVASAPIAQFRKWFNEAIKAGIREPHAMTLATAERGTPRARVVLMKEFGERGFAFATSYLSAKAREISKNKEVSLSFFWAELERQVRIVGKIKKAPASLSDDYFNARPRGSQIAAHLFAQSSPLKSRSQLEARYAEVEAKFLNKQIPRPKGWGAYIVEPTAFEFWQGRRNRLHDRICYEKKQRKWIRHRLAP